MIGRVPLEAEQLRPAAFTVIAVLFGTLGFLAKSAWDLYWYWARREERESGAVG